MIAWAVLLLSLFSWSVSALPKLNSPVSKTSIQKANSKCSCRTGQAEHFRDLVEKVSIRGEDTRQTSGDYAATLRVGCFNEEGKAKGRGSGNLVGGNKVVTVLHNFVDENTCEAFSNPDNCFVLMDKKSVKFKKWSKDLVELCKKNKDQGNVDGDGVVVAELEESIDSIESYKIKCKENMDPKNFTSVKVAGAKADNSKLAVVSGKEAIVSEGDTYSFDRAKGTITYSNDTGAKTSGGAVTSANDKVLIAVHAGDFLDGEADTAFKSGKSTDGFEADAEKNHGRGFVIDAKALGLECEK